MIRHTTLLFAMTILLIPALSGQASAQFLCHNQVSGNEDGATADATSMACGTTATAAGTNATAIGNNSSAAGANATAIGDQAAASGANASAIGASASASGDNDTATGRGAQATGTNSTATGQGAEATGANSTAIGQGAEASGATSTAVGFTATASGANSAAFGAAANVSANNATAIGDGSSATAAGASAFGRSALASGVNATALGFGATASGVGGIAIGQGATSNTAGSIAIGQGASTAGFTNSMAIGQNVQAARNDQIIIGSTNNTYTLAGIGSAASRTAQGTPTHFVTSNANGDLAAYTAAELGLASPSDVAAINTRLGAHEARIKSNTEGIAIALAMAGTPIVMPRERFAMSANWGNFEGSHGFAAALAMRVTENVQINGGLGFGSTEGTVGGRAGVRVGW